jgi:hypothetical protein
MSIVLDTPDAIDAFRVRALRSALKLECLGMTRRGQSVYSIVKQEFGFKGSKQKVLDQLNKYIEDNE